MLNKLFNLTNQLIIAHDKLAYKTNTEINIPEVITDLRQCLSTLHRHILDNKELKNADLLTSIEVTHLVVDKLISVGVKEYTRVQKDMVASSLLQLISIIATMVCSDLNTIEFDYEENMKKMLNTLVSLHYTGRM